MTLLEWICTRSNIVKDKFFRFEWDLVYFPSAARSFPVTGGAGRSFADGFWQRFAMLIKPVKETVTDSFVAKVAMILSPVLVLMKSYCQYFNPGDFIIRRWGTFENVLPQMDLIMRAASCHIFAKTRNDSLASLFRMTCASLTALFILWGDTRSLFLQNTNSNTGGAELLSKFTETSTLSVECAREAGKCEE